MKYDDASWHYGGDFPENIPDEAGGTHIGMFVTWCLLNGLVGKLHIEEFSEGLNELKNRKLTPGAWFLNNCDEKFTDEDLNQEGNKFARYYYDLENGLYLNDYERTVGKNIENLYHVPDTWDTYEKLEPVISARFDKWKQTSNHILSITNAFTGEWKSHRHDIAIKFNKKIWSLVEEIDDDEDTLIAFFDKSDGSTFYIRVEHLENAQEIADSVLEEALAEGLHISDPKLEVKNRNNIEIAGRYFYSIDYLFNNNKFGKQLVRHSFIKKENHIIIFLTSWPETLHIENTLFPIKHMAFMEGINL